MTDFKKWVQTIRIYRLPRYTELPNIGLYMDQVVEIIDRILQPLFVGNEKIITATMINNYVKHKMIAKPEKKKYGRDHIASIITITILKQTLSISEISKGISLQLDIYKIEDAYNHLCDHIEDSLQSVCDHYLRNDTIPLFATSTPKNDYFLKLITICFATKIITEKYIVFKEASDIKLLGERSYE